MDRAFKTLTATLSVRRDFKKSNVNPNPKIYLADVFQNLIFTFFGHIRSFSKLATQNFWVLFNGFKSIIFTQVRKMQISPARIFKSVTLWILDFRHHIAVLDLLIEVIYCSCSRPLQVPVIFPYNLVLPYRDHWPVPLPQVCQLFPILTGPNPSPSPTTLPLSRPLLFLKFFTVIYIFFWKFWRFFGDLTVLNGFSYLHEPQFFECQGYAKYFATIFWKYQDPPQNNSSLMGLNG